MDSNSNSYYPTKPSSQSALQLKRELQRNSQRKEDIENKLKTNRQQYMYEYEKLYLKQQELKKEVCYQLYKQELTLTFNRSVEQAFEYFISDEVDLALDVMITLEPKLNKLEEIPSAFDITQFVNFFKQVGQQLVANNQIDYHLLFIILDSINQILFLNEPSNLSQETQTKALDLLAQEKHKFGEVFITRLYQNTKSWFEAVQRQRLSEMNNKLFEHVLSHIGTESVWIILKPLNRIPYCEKIFHAIQQHRFEQNAFAILKKTLGYEEYLQKFLQTNIFFTFAQILQQTDNRKYFLNEIIDCILSICCLKFELFEKVITSGLAVVLATQPVSYFSFEGIMNLQRIVYWMQNENSKLLQQQIQDSVWFQNFFLILLQQQQNMATQQNTLDLLKQQLKSEKGSYFRDFFRQTHNLPDNVKSQIERYL